MDASRSRTGETFLQPCAAWRALGPLVPIVTSATVTLRVGSIPRNS